MRSEIPANSTLHSSYIELSPRDSLEDGESRRNTSSRSDSDVFEDDPLAVPDNGSHDSIQPPAGTPPLFEPCRTHLNALCGHNSDVEAQDSVPIKPEARMTPLPELLLETSVISVVIGIPWLLAQLTMIVGGICKPETSILTWMLSVLVYFGFPICWRIIIVDYAADACHRWTHHPRATGKSLTMTILSVAMLLALGALVVVAEWNANVCWTEAAAVTGNATISATPGNAISSAGTLGHSRTTGHYPII